MNQHNHDFPETGGPTSREPAFNLPPVIVGLSGIMIVIHLLRVYVLSAQQNTEVLLYFAFLPIRYANGFLFSGEAPGGAAADIWTFVTYAFLHGGAAHLIFNLAWMVIFGTAVARRFGAVRFLILSAVCSIAGAALHLVFHFGDNAPVIGASAAISGHMAAAIRFVFEHGGPLSAMRSHDDRDYRMPAVSLAQSFSNRQVVTFIAVWFGLNIAIGLIGVPFSGGMTIAWEAHIGGFIAGLLLFPLLDPVGRHSGSVDRSV